LVLVILSAYALPETLDGTKAKSQVKCYDALESIIHKALEGTKEYVLATLEGIEEYALLLVLFSLFFCFFLGCFSRYFF